MHIACSYRVTTQMTGLWQVITQNTNEKRYSRAENF